MQIRLSVIKLLLLTMCLCSSADLALAEEQCNLKVAPKKTDSIQETTAQQIIQPFLSDCQRRIERTWEKQNFKNAKLTCEFTIENMAGLTDLKIKQTSGSEIIDSAAINTIRTAGIRPALVGLQNPLITIEFLGTNTIGRLKTRISWTSTQDGKTGIYRRFDSGKKIY